MEASVRFTNNVRELCKVLRRDLGVKIRVTDRAEYFAEVTAFTHTGAVMGILNVHCLAGSYLGGRSGIFSLPPTEEIVRENLNNIFS